MEFYYKGQKYNVETFATQFCSGSIEDASRIIAELSNRNLIIELNSNNSKDDLNKHKKTQAEYDEADNIANAEEAEEYFRRDKQAESKPTYEKILYDFYNLYEAREFEALVRKTIKTTETEVIIGNGISSVKVCNITNFEALQLKALYNAKRTVKNTVKATDKVTGAVADAVSFTGTNIIAPIAKVGLKGAGRLLRGIISTTAKVAGNIITTTGSTIGETMQDIKSDPDVLIAKTNIKRTFDNLRGTVNNMGYNSNGIHYQ